MDTLNATVRSSDRARVKWFTLGEPIESAQTHLNVQHTPSTARHLTSDPLRMTQSTRSVKKIRQGCPAQSYNPQ